MPHCFDLEHTWFWDFGSLCHEASRRPEGPSATAAANSGFRGFSVSLQRYAVRVLLGVRYVLGGAVRFLFCCRYTLHLRRTTRVHFDPIVMESTEVSAVPAERIDAKTGIKESPASVQGTVPFAQFHLLRARRVPFVATLVPLAPPPSHQFLQESRSKAFTRLNTNVIEL